MTPRQRKSEWTGMVVDSPRDQEAVRSWFGGMIRDEDAIVSARMLTRISDDAPVKLQAVVRIGQDRTREFTRTFGRRFSITAKPAVQTCLAALATLLCGAGPAPAPSDLMGMNFGTGIGHIDSPDMGTVWQDGHVDLHWPGICQTAGRIGGNEYMREDQKVARALIAARRKACTVDELSVPTETWRPGP